MSAYVPEAGDIVWLEFSPQAGHEQAGHRPALVLSKTAYNRKTGLAVFCPIISKVKGYPFEVVISGAKISGVALADQIKSLDWRSRNAAFVEKAHPNVLQEVSAKLAVILA